MVYLIIQPNFTCVVGQIHPLSLEIMPKNRPGKRDRSKSAKKDVPAAQKSKTTTGVATEEQIISPLGSIPLEQGGSKGGEQPTTVDQQVGGESVGVNTSPEQGGGRSWSRSGCVIRPKGVQRSC